MRHPLFGLAFVVLGVTQGCGGPQADSRLDASRGERDAGNAATNTDSGVTSGASSYFPSGSIWTRDISSVDKADESDAWIASLEDAGGWGAGNRMRIDFSIVVLQAGADTPLRAFEPTDDFYSPDCDALPVPVPSNGALEGEDGYSCESDGDCHLIVRQNDTLYEMWRANIVGDTFYGGCLAVWDLTRVYGATGRGEQCTSADAAGFPIAPLLFTADEVAAGEIPHAIRFILPNDRIRERTYVAPATHGTNTSGGSDAPPYGVHLRLRADYPLDSLPNDAARTVAHAMQRYGMFLADGGNMALTAQSDRFSSSAQWDGLLGPDDLSSLSVTDFEAIHEGELVPVTYDCVRDAL